MSAVALVPLTPFLQDMKKKYDTRISNLEELRGVPNRGSHIFTVKVQQVLGGQRLTWRAKKYTGKIIISRDSKTFQIGKQVFGIEGFGEGKLILDIKDKTKEAEELRSRLEQYSDLCF